MDQQIHQYCCSRILARRGTTHPARGLPLRIRFENSKRSSIAVCAVTNNSRLDLPTVAVVVDIGDWDRLPQSVRPQRQYYCIFSSKPHPGKLEANTSKDYTKNMALRNTNDDGLHSNDTLDDAINDDPETWKTWEEASLQCCLKQRTFTVTLQQVFNRLEGKAFDWPIPSRKDVQIFSSDCNVSDIGGIVEFIIKRQAEEAAIGTNKDGSSSPSVASKVLWSTVSSVGWSVSKGFALGKKFFIGDDDVEEWRQAGDHALNGGYNPPPVSD